VTGLAAAGLLLVLARDWAIWHGTRAELAEIRAEAERMEWVALRETDEIVTVAQAAAIVGRSASTIRNWLAAGKLHRVDSGGPGVPASLRLGDVFRAEHGVRGRGRPPTAGT
jgi:hypothetical protein